MGLYDKLSRLVKRLFFKWETVGDELRPGVEVHLLRGTNANWFVYPETDDTWTVVKSGAVDTATSWFVSLDEAKRYAEDQAKAEAEG